MNSLYNLALRQSSSIQSELTLIESTPPQSSSFTSLAGQLSASFAALGRTVDDYESMAKRELNVQKREKALQRVKKFREEEREMHSFFQSVKNNTHGGGSATRREGSGTALSSSIATNGTMRSPMKDSALRTDVPPVSSSSTGALSNDAASSYALHARSSTQAVSASNKAQHAGALPPQDRPDPLSAYRMNASAAAMFGGGENGSMSAREGHALREHSFIRETETQLDSFIAQGREVWSNLTEQRDILKGTQRKLRDVGVTLGLSRNVIGYIERRSTQDNILFVVGAIMTLVCFYYIYKWFG